MLLNLIVWLKITSNDVMLCKLIYNDETFKLRKNHRSIIFNVWKCWDLLVSVSSQYPYWLLFYFCRSYPTQSLTCWRHWTILADGASSRLLWVCDNLGFLFDLEFLPVFWSQSTCIFKWRLLVWHIACIFVKSATHLCLFALKIYIIIISSHFY